MFVNNISTKEFHKENQLAKAFVCVIRVILKKKRNRFLKKWMEEYVNSFEFSSQRISYSCD